MSVLAIDIQGVRKAFKRRERDAGAPWWRREQKEKVALHELDLIVEAGGVTGILGPNGSGKSTLIRILGTLLTPDTGRAMVFGWDVVTDALQVRRRVNRGSVEAAFFKELSPWEDMDEASALCDRVLMLDGGRVLADGSPDELRARHGAATLEDVFMDLTGKTLEAEEAEEAVT